MHTNLPKQIVILGCGFGGMYVARQLLPYVHAGEIEITIINKTNYFLFTPLLHEVATGGLSYGSISESLREIFPHTGVRIFEGDVETVDANRKHVSIGEKNISYDYLVVATGSETNYYHTPGAREYTLPLKSLDDARVIKSKIIDSFERALLATSEERKELLTFIIVGGGATGVEFAAEVAQFTEILAKRYFSNSGIEAGDIAIHLITAAKEILSQFNPELQRSGLARLQKQGVRVHFEMPVSEVLPGEIKTPSASMRGKNIFWMAGVKPLLPLFAAPLVLTPSGRIQTNQFLQAESDTAIFALGDSATPVSSDKKELPMLAQTASQEAGIVAGNIIALIKNRPLATFTFKNKGSLISLGQWFAIGEIYSHKIAGKSAWWIWRTVYLFKFPHWRKRFKIAFEWTGNLLYPRDITKPE